jgi:plastocyanin
MAKRSALSAWLAMACIVGVLTGCGIFGPAHGPPDPQANAVIDMGFHRFKPTTITIYAGQTVEWRNVSLLIHTVTDDPQLAKYPADALLPPGVPPFDSGNVAAGNILLFKFSKPGTYRYFCKHHERQGMIGTITVLPAP